MASSVTVVVADAGCDGIGSAHHPTISWAGGLVAADADCKASCARADEAEAGC